MKSEKIVSYAIWGIVALIILIILLGATYTIPAGYRGVLLTFGKPDMASQGEGLHFKLPLVQKIVKMNVQTQIYEVEGATAASKDLQDAFTNIAVNYYISPEAAPEIYRDIGINYKDKVIVPAVLEVLKASTAQYTAEELVTRRPEVKEKIDAGLKERLTQFNVVVQTTSITNFKFSEVFSSAIESKVTATQLKLKADQDLQRIEIEAKQKVVQATAEAESLRLQKQQITPELLTLRQIEVQSKSLDVQSKAIEKWSGVLPQVTGNNIPFINVDLNPAAKTTTNK